MILDSLLARICIILDNMIIILSKLTWANNFIKNYTVINK